MGEGETKSDLKKLPLKSSEEERVKRDPLPDKSLVETLLGLEITQSSCWRKLLSLLQSDKTPQTDGMLVDLFALVDLQLCALLADDLLDSSGDILRERLEEIRAHIPGGEACLSPHWQGFTPRLEQIARVLNWLGDDYILEQWAAIFPMQERLVDELIDACVRLLPYQQHEEKELQGSKDALSENLYSRQASVRATRFAVLSGWMYYLRQNIGSCFATAPAIVVQQFQPGYFLADCQQLLSRRGITRVIDGHEFTVPMATSFGEGMFFQKFPPKELECSPLAKGILELAMKARPGGAGEKLDYSQEGLLSSLLKRSKGYELISLADLVERSLENFSTKSSQERTTTSSRFLTRDPLSAQSGASTTLPPHIALSESLSDSAGAKLGGQEERLRGGGRESHRLLLEAIRGHVARLSDHPLVKVWEYSLASFSETRHRFCRWNLYISLGMDRSHKGGIGDYLYEDLNGRLEVANREAEQVRDQLEPLRDRVNFAAARLNSAHGESELSWLQTDYKNVKAEYESLDQQHLRLRTRAHKLAQLYNTLLDRYDALFPQYFQEVYDPNMGDALEQHRLYDDRPAGFRLLFKAGRSSSAQWEAIYSAAQYIEALSAFFRISEMDLSQDEEVKGIERDVSEVVTGLMQHVRSSTFLESAFHRLLQERGVANAPLELHLLESSTTTPWCYVSGGTMDALVSHYYGRLEDARMARFTPHQADELWVFLIDTMRSLPSWQRDKMRTEPGIPLLMHSGDHAFTLRAQKEPFASSWRHKGYPYSWIRDRVVTPQLDFYHGMTLSKAQQLFLLKQVIKKWPYDVDLYVIQAVELAIGARGEGAFFSDLLRPSEFASSLQHLLGEQLLKTKIARERAGAAQLLQEVISSTLWSHLPLLDRGDFLEKIEELIEEKLPDSLKKGRVFSVVREERTAQLQKELKRAIQELLAQEQESFLGPDRSWTLLLLGLERTLRDLLGIEGKVSMDLGSLYRALFSYKIAPMAPSIFGDSNWPREEIGFVVNPASMELEVWRVYPERFLGTSMTRWNRFEQDATYGIFSDPLQYKLA